MTPILECSLLAVSTASIAMTITQTPVFYFVRQWLEKKEYYFLLKLMECPYCMSHWVAGMFTLIYHPPLFGERYIDLFPTWFFIVTLAAFMVQWLLIGGKIISYFKEGE